MIFYGISTLTDDPAEADIDWDKEATKKWANRCGHWKKDHPLDIKLQHIGENLPINFVHHPGDFLFAKIDFLEAIDPQISIYFQFGHLYDKQGRKIEGFMTFRAREPKYSIIIRGGPNSDRNFCKGCGRFGYMPLPKFYILQQNLGDSEIYQGNFPDLILSERVFKRLSRWTDEPQKNKLDIRKLPIISKPNDGLPIDLSSLKPGDIEETP